MRLGPAAVAHPLLLLVAYLTSISSLAYGLLLPPSSSSNNNGNASRIVAPVDDNAVFRNKHQQYNPAAGGMVPYDHQQQTVHVPYRDVRLNELYSNFTKNGFSTEDVDNDDDDSINIGEGMFTTQVAYPGDPHERNNHQYHPYRVPPSLASDDHRKEDQTTPTAWKRKHLTVGYLTAIKGQGSNVLGLQASGALTMALEEINNSPDILPNVTLVVRWNDTKGDTVVATRAMTEMICDGVAAFFGPINRCYVEAVVAQSRNIPMISYKCSDSKASDIPTFARTEPPDTQVTKSVISLLKYYDWKKFSIIYEEDKETVALSLVQQAKLRKNMTITNYRKAADPHKCCEDSLPCCQSSYWFQLIQETKNKTRIYVFLGSPTSLIELMGAMQTTQLFDNGEYMVIYVDWDTYTDKGAYKYLWKPETLNNHASCYDHQKDFLKRGRSLFVVVPTAPTENYEQFITRVREYNGKEPFNFGIPSVLSTYQKFVSIHAAYLYDSVQLYATALHELIKNCTDITEAEIDEIARNGTRIIEKIIELGTYRSITGATMQLDKNGDSEGNFSVLALTRTSRQVTENFSCDYQMRPVGQFQPGEFPDYQIYTNVKIEWPGGGKPNDEPSCGFDNEMCRKGDTHLNSIIAAGTLAIMLFCAGVITMSIYRKWKIEQEIEGLLWKIDRVDIRNYYEPEIMSSPSKLSLVSASVNSYESRGGAQVFATTALYRGLIARIKELNFARKKDISRDVMKEMRLLRDLRHDNINSFIGACIEPMSILLVTDYCAKGSLYDIIENEDIKLDKMFIASLVHDLIKGMLYIHNSMLICHGNLKSSNCVVTSRWVLQVTDFGLAEIRQCAENESIGEHQYYRSLFWKAPELLRNPTAFIRGTQKGDVYAFAIILYEIIGRKGPFGTNRFEPKDIIELVKNPTDVEDPFRPEIDVLLDLDHPCDEYVLQCMKDCWAENAESRPDFASIRSRLKKMKDGKNRNIMDQMMEMMVKYADNLEEIVEERTRLLYEEKMKTEDLLHRMLPKPVAVRLTKGHGIEPEWFDLVTIYFSDIVGFTAMSAESTPLQVVNFLNDLYTVFDRIIKGYDVYKVETIGDAYMVVSGLPIRNEDKHAGEIASMALDLLAAVKNHSISHRPKETLKLRIGIHTGSVVAGVVGLTMPRYCLFGDTVNTASRMESTGEPLKIHISQQCKTALDKIGGYNIEQRGLISMKGKGEVLTYWLTGATETAIQRREVDLGELPPLFCRPRKSPKMNNMGSRQASVCGVIGFGGMAAIGMGMGSRRHSSVPRGTSIEVDSTSTLNTNNANPLHPLSGSPPQSRHQLLSKVQTLPTCAHNHNSVSSPPLTDNRLTIDDDGSTFGSGTIEPPHPPQAKNQLRSRRVLSSIASSSTDEPAHHGGGDHHSLVDANITSPKSKSLDPLPLITQQQLDYVSQYLQTHPLPQMTSLPAHRSTRSLEQCCCDVQIIAIPEPFEDHEEDNRSHHRQRHNSTTELMTVMDNQSEDMGYYGGAYGLVQPPPNGRVGVYEDDEVLEGISERVDEPLLSTGMIRVNTGGNVQNLGQGEAVVEMETQSMPMPLAQHQHHALQMYQQQHNRRRHKPNVHVNAAETMSLEDAAKLEMASLPTKTPVSVLQELLSRRGNTPNYELVQIEGAIHEPIFRYRVLLNAEFVATGTGRSKKEAKHAAAKNLLDLLVGLQTSEQANSGGTTGPNGIPIEGINNSSLPASLYPNSSGDESSKVAGNPIGWLQEMCMSRRWPPPTYDMEHEEGLPHERLFTICCRVLKYREQGTGRSKKLAKRMAAHKMWQQLQELPAAEVGNMVIAAGEVDELISRPPNPQTRYAGLKDSKVSTLFNNPNSNKVTQFHKLLKSARGAKVKELQVASLCSKDFNHVQFLQEIAGELKFEVTYVDIEEKSITGKFQCLVQMSTLPVAVCYGRGITSKDAQISAAHNALEYLKVMTRK